MVDEKLKNKYIKQIFNQLRLIENLNGATGLRLWMLESSYDRLFEHENAVDDFIERIKIKLQEGDHKVAELEFTLQSVTSLPEKSWQINDAVSYSLLKISGATISAIPGKGTLHQASYVLELKNKKVVYHIGRCVCPDLQGMIRINDIAIKEDETNIDQLNINNHVSRNHADIKVMNGQFYLRATSRGVVQGTKILRESEPQPLKILNEKVCVPLKDGDVILLGTDMMMYFSVTISEF